MYDNVQASLLVRDVVANANRVCLHLNVAFGIPNIGVIDSLLWDVAL